MSVCYHEDTDSLAISGNICVAVPVQIITRVMCYRNSRHLHFSVDRLHVGRIGLVFATRSVA